MRKFLGLAALAITTAAIAQQPPAPAPTDVARQQAEADKVPDTPGDGPFPATMEVDPKLPGFVVYRPADLRPFTSGRSKLGLFVWGNGACAADGSSARQHLAEIASYGYLVIAPGKWQSGPHARDPRIPAPPPPPAGTAGTRPPVVSPTKAEDLRHALDWALDSKGIYRRLIDPAAVAIGGFSCGGAQALRLAGDPRLRTVVIENSGLFSEPTGMAEMDMPKSQLMKLHTPVLYLLGGPTDIAYANGTDDFKRIDHVPAVLVNIPTGHGGTYSQPMGGKAAGIVVDWLQWQLRHDMGAARTFVGANCRLCRDSGATIETKHLP